MSVNDIRFRSEGEMIVLQISVDKARSRYYENDLGSEWRDARVEDMLDVAEHLRMKYADEKFNPASIS